MSVKSTITLIVEVNSNTQDEAYQHIAAIGSAARVLFDRAPKDFPPVIMKIGEVQIDGKSVSLKIEEVSSSERVH